LLGINQHWHFLGFFLKGYFGTWKNLSFIWHIKFFAHIDCANCFSLEWDKNVGKLSRGEKFENCNSICLQNPIMLMDDSNVEKFINQLMKKL